MALASNVPVTPKLAEANTLPPTAFPAIDVDIEASKKYAEEIRARAGDFRTLESRLSFVGIRPGWTRRWCNDEGDNIPRRLADGWCFVKRGDVGMSASVGKGNEDLGDRVTITSTTGGPPIKVFLMEIPTEIAEEILNVRSLSKVRAIEDTIRAGTIGVTSGRTYNPGENPQSSFFGVRNRVEHPTT